MGGSQGGSGGVGWGIMGKIRGGPVGKEAKGMRENDFVKVDH